MNPDLVVVGGGWAGCAAALGASRRGLRVALLEAGPRLGGRASSFVDPVDGGLLDAGQHLFLGAYRETLGLLEELGTAGMVEFRRPLRVPYWTEDGRLLVLQAGRLPGPLSLAVGLARFPGLDRPARALGSLALGGAPALGAACLGRPPRSADGVSVARWLRDCGQDAAAVAWIWEPMVLAALNARPEQARLTEFLQALAQGFLKGGFSASLGLARVPLARLLEPLPQVLRAQGSLVSLGAAALRVEARTGGGWRVHARGGSSLDSRRLVLALPAAAAARLLGPVPSAALGLGPQAGRPSSAIVGVWLWSDGPLLPEPLLAFGPQAGRPPRFHWGFSRPCPGGWRTGVVASACGDLADASASAVEAQLAAFFAARGLPGRWRRCLVVRERRATPVFAPGSAPRAPQATPLRGLALAGDWTETGLPATIEGAVRSGRLALQTLSFDER